VNLTDILKGAFGAYRRHPRGLFLVAAPAVVVTPAWTLVSSLFEDFWVVVVVILPVAFWVVCGVPAAALVRAGADTLGGTPPHFWRSYAAVVSRLGPLMLAALRFWVIFQALSIIVVGTPLAFYLLIRWLFFQQAIMLEDARAGEALKRSGDVVTGSWWRVFGIMLVIMIVSAGPTFFVSFVLFPGPPGGFGGLGLLSPPAAVSIAVTSVIGTLMLPFAVSAETILFLDLRARHGRAAAAAT